MAVRKISILEQLYKSGNLGEKEYQAGLWYQRTWHLYVSVIEAPKVKTSHQYLEDQTSTAWSEEFFCYIENRWNQAQEILRAHGQHTRALLDQVICFDMPCHNVFRLKSALRELDREMGKRLKV